MPTEYSWWYGDSANQLPSEFRIKKVGAAGSKLEDQPVVASFQVGQVERVLKYKDNLVLFRRQINTDPSKRWTESWTSELQVYSLADPEKNNFPGSKLSNTHFQAPQGPAIFPFWPYFFFFFFFKLFFWF